MFSWRDPRVAAAGLYPCHGDAHLDDHVLLPLSTTLHVLLRTSTAPPLTISNSLFLLQQIQARPLCQIIVCAGSSGTGLGPQALVSPLETKPSSLLSF